MDFVSLMQLTDEGGDRFRGTGPTYPWGGLYGGQILAQALRAACHTVGPALSPHSLHAYFIRSGDASQPILFEVQRVRDGRSFATRSVSASQAGEVILQMSTSFHRNEDGPDVAPSSMPQAPEPGERDNSSWSPLFDRRFTHEGGAKIGPRGWFKLLESLPDDPVLHTCAMVFMSDDLPTESVLVAHPDQPVSLEHFWCASLDHAMWFHRPGRADDWCLHDFAGQSLTQGRGLGQGRIYGQNGVLVASVAQEIVVRPARRTEPG